uniref:HTH psq-type domain-containing protein n=1 Tax=Clytia hemisphaerica TaxID=252671 RepID=A0A7M5WMN0_9CNID
MGPSCPSCLLSRPDYHICYIRHKASFCLNKRQQNSEQNIIFSNMADDEVASNSEVFDDVDSDPGSIINNVVESCSKILIPSMAQPSMNRPHNEEEVNTTDAIFHTDHDDEGINTKSDEESSLEDQNTDDVVNNIKRGSPLLEDKQRISGHSPRVVRWTLDTMAAAMDAVFAGEMTTTNASRKFGIPRTTLLDRLSMKVKRQHLDCPGSFPLNADNDAKVVDFILANQNLDKQTLIKGLLSLGEELASMQGRPFNGPLNSRKWLKLFVQKHPNLNVFSYSRSRAPSSRSVSFSGTSSHARLQSSSISNDNTVLIPQQILHIQHDPLAQLQSEHGTEQDSPTLPDNDNVFDSLESSLAKQGVRAIEQKLGAEQLSYFNYRYMNKNLERGYELWKLCKIKTDAGDNLSTFALSGVEEGLVEEHLKYFRFRYDNTELEEGYKLWAVLREKMHE